MKHINSNFGVIPFVPPVLPDGVLDTLSIDSFPVKDESFYKQDGWPASDVSILDRFSRDSNVDKELIAQIAQRLEVIKTSPRDNMSDEEKLKHLKPAWVQTAAELADYERMVIEFMESDKETAKDEVAVSDDIPSEEIVESKEA